MAIGTLLITRYETSSGAYRCERVANPDWEAIESAIRALDRDLLPFVWMYRSPDADDDSDLPDFEVLGGDGAYFMMVRGDDYELMYDDQERGEERVDVWISDQGASFPARNVCPDIEEVILAAKTFFEDGTPRQATKWTAT